MKRSLLCARTGCNVAFRPHGNRRYCSAECRREARRRQNRLAQRRHRLREYFAQIETARKAGPPGHLSALRKRAGPFHLPLRRLQRPGPPSRAAALRLLL
jgi:hypothetical protein